MTVLGEGGIRLRTPPGEQLETARSLEVQVVGSEANVGANLSRLGWRCAWVSRLPRTALGDRVLATYRNHGLNVDAVSRVDHGRLGVYFVDYGLKPRPIEVIYDRAGTAFQQLTIDDIDLDTLLDTRIVHLSGVTAGLSEGCLKLVREVVARARALGVPVSFDVNYRTNLWPESDAGEALREVLRGTEVLFCSHRDARSLFGIDCAPEYVADGLASLTGSRIVATSLGPDGVHIISGSDHFHEAAFGVDIIDRLGAGDALAAGVLHGYLSEDLESSARYGVAMAALAMSQVGEQLITSRDEFERIAQNPENRLCR